MRSYLISRNIELNITKRQNFTIIGNNLSQASRNFQIIFAAVKHFFEELRFETSFTLQLEKFLICSAGTWRSTVPMIEQQLILFLETLIMNTASGRCRLE
jgi:hypothetical protein